MRASGRLADQAAPLLASTQPHRLVRSAGFFHCRLRSDCVAVGRRLGTARIRARAGPPRDRALQLRVAKRLAPRRGASLGERLGRLDDRLVFVVGSPRSGTTFLAGAIGSLPGFVDLGEVPPLKAAVPELVASRADGGRTAPAQDPRRRAARRVSSAPIRAVEQTPELAHLVDVVAPRLPRGADRPHRPRRPRRRLLAAREAVAPAPRASGSGRRRRRVRRRTRGSGSSRDRRDEFERVERRAPRRLGVAQVRHAPRERRRPVGRDPLRGAGRGDPTRSPATLAAAPRGPA